MVSTREIAKNIIAQHCVPHDKTLPEYEHFAFPGVEGFGVGLYKGTKDIICYITVHEAERDIWWRLGDKLNYLAPSFWPKADVREDGYISTSFRNDFIRNKEGFEAWFAQIVNLVATCTEAQS